MAAAPARTAHGRIEPCAVARRAESGAVGEEKAACGCATLACGR